MTADPTSFAFPHRHVLGIEELSPDDITAPLDRSESYIAHNRQTDKKQSLLRADVTNTSAQGSSIKQGELN